VTAAMLERGVATSDVVARVLAATHGAAGGVGASWDWAQEERGLKRMCTDWARKHPRPSGTVINIRAPYDNAHLFQAHGCALTISRRCRRRFSPAAASAKP
jgi:hypothetical protein